MQTPLIPCAFVLPGNGGEARPEPSLQPFPVRFRPTADRRKGNDDENDHSEKSTIHGKKGELTLRQLRDVLPSTKGAKTPTRDWVRDHLDSDQVFFAKQYEGGNRLVVFTNGFYTYGDQNWTVLRVDGFSRILYETNEYGGYAAMNEEAYLDHCFVFAIGMNAMWQLKRNAVLRKAHKVETLSDNSIMSINADKTADVLDRFIEEEEENENQAILASGLRKFSKEDQEIFRLFQRKTEQEEIAAKTGLAKRTVSYRIEGGIKKLKESFGM